MKSVFVKSSIFKNSLHAYSLLLILIIEYVFCRNQCPYDGLCDQKDITEYIVQWTFLVGRTEDMAVVVPRETRARWGAARGHGGARVRARRPRRRRAAGASHWGLFLAQFTCALQTRHHLCESTLFRHFVTLKDKSLPDGFLLLFHFKIIESIKMELNLVNSWIFQ